MTAEDWTEWHLFLDWHQEKTGVGAMPLLLPEHEAPTNWKSGSWGGGSLERQA